MRTPGILGQPALLCLFLLAGAINSKEIKVKPGQRIQDAINGASSGDQITVAKGNYTEQLVINKSGIQLVGQDGATLTPPSPLVANGCTGMAGNNTQAGICIIGTNVMLGNVKNNEHREFISVGSLVENVLVKGFGVHGFDGLNIAIVGAKNAEVRENTVLDGTHYGILTVGSKNTIITRNTVNSVSRNFIGICMDDQSDVSVTSNSISDYMVGLCVQTNKAVVSHNKVNNCCVGAYVDPGIDSAHVTHNSIVGTKDASCLLSFGLIVGIVIDGASNTDVQHNDITGVSDSGTPDYPAPAIWLYDYSGPVATGSIVDFNTLSGNDFNILNLSAGKNEIKHNTCTGPSDNCNF
ncbi:pectin lyase-like protein [Thozetella sp. PMI_491]|nr:pectin lyase-like protein [Thozetella sp. PMI_491]